MNYTPKQKIRALKRLGAILYDGSPYIKNAPPLLYKIIEQSIGFAHEFLRTDPSAWMSMDEALNADGWHTTRNRALGVVNEDEAFQYIAFNYGKPEPNEYEAWASTCQAAVYEVFMQICTRRTGP